MHKFIEAAFCSSFLCVVCGIRKMKNNSLKTKSLLKCIIPVAEVRKLNFQSLCELFSLLCKSTVLNMRFLDKSRLLHRILKMLSINLLLFHREAISLKRM